jgi:hypothetical protein
MRLRISVLVTVGLALTLSGVFTAANAQVVTRELKVGQKAHITAYRGNNCSAPAPSFSQIVGRLPKSNIVKYSDGGTSSRNSNECGKRVPTRAVDGTGIKKGTETHRYQNTVKIVVK